jgi:hypothetical protein
MARWPFSCRLFVAEAAMAPIERMFLLLAMTGLIGLVSSFAYLLASQ